MSAEHGGNNMGLTKHRTAGHVHNSLHFTGKQGSSSKRKRKKTRAQRRKNRGTHSNKYAAASHLQAASTTSPAKPGMSRGTHTTYTKES